MRKARTLSLIILFVVLFSAFNKLSHTSAISLTRSPQRAGNASEGWKYITEGDYVNSGLPYYLYKPIFGKEDLHLIKRDGENNNVAFYFNIVKGVNEKNIIVPNCLQCHADVFDGKLIVGLGRANGNFTKEQRYGSHLVQDITSFAFKQFLPADYKGAETFINNSKPIRSDFLMENWGSNPGSRLSALVMQYHDPVTLKAVDKPVFQMSKQIIPSDIPPWWGLKKKATMYYSGEARGDFGKFLMISALLTLNDTLEAAKVDAHMPDVLSFIESVQPPEYPHHIDKELAKQGNQIFINKCSKCHGSYGEQENYPNLLIHQKVIGTDSLLWKSNFTDPEVMKWYNKSWFSKGPHGGQLIGFEGYIAPPLDGVWITAPYLHNGSVPTIEALLNSELRPKYWSRNFDKTEYDYEKLGWKFKSESKPGGTKTYNTTLPGYGNYGHYFGDALSDEHRKALIEYLKTL